MAGAIASSPFRGEPPSVAIRKASAVVALALTLPGPPWLCYAPCPVPVSEATPGEQDSPRAGGKAEQKSQHEHCQPFGQCDMRLYL